VEDDLFWAAAASSSAAFAARHRSCGVSAWSGEHGHADAHRDVHAVRATVEALEAHGRALDRRAQALGDRQHVLLHHGRGQQDGELLAAPARHRVERPHARAQRLGHLHEHLVAGLEPERGVERLEVVDIANQQRERAVSRVARDLVAICRS
jgi:hypothetical protein